MSFHFLIDKKLTVSYQQLLEKKPVPEQTQVAFKNDLESGITGYSRFFLNNQSSRGVALTVNDHEYDIELNIGASKEDYILATQMALALAVLNDSPISPEYDEPLTIDEFQKNYNADWAASMTFTGIDSVKAMVTKGTMKLPSCVRPYYFGAYTFEKLSRNEESFADHLIDDIRRLQFIENEVQDLEIPTLMEADFPEGTKQLIVVAPGFKLLIQKCDYIIIRTDKMNRIAHQQFIETMADKLERLDEEQYILQPIGSDDIIRLTTEDTAAVKSNPYTIGASGDKREWWQFWKK